MTDALNWVDITKGIQNFVVGGSGLAPEQVAWEFEGINRKPGPYITLQITYTGQVAHDWTTKRLNPITFSALPVVADAGTNQITSAAHGRKTGDGPVHFLNVGGALPSPLEAGVDYYLVVIDPNTLKIADSFVHTGGDNVARGLGVVPNPITTIDLLDAGSGTTTIVATSVTVRAGQEIKKTAQGYREIRCELQCFAPEKTGTLAMAIMSNVVSSLPFYTQALDDAGVGINDLGDLVSVESAVRAKDSKRGQILEPRTVWELTFYVASHLEAYESFVERVSVTVHETSTNTTFDVQAP